MLISIELRCDFCGRELILKPDNERIITSGAFAAVMTIYKCPACTQRMLDVIRTCEEEEKKIEAAG